MRRAPRAGVVAVAAAALVLGGCGSGARDVNRIPGKRLVIYMSGPLHGASSSIARADMNGARLALTQEGQRIGRYVISLRTLDDATPQSTGWDPSQTSLNARLAAQDPDTIGYIGETNSGASAISIPVLNRAGIVQVSPSSSAVGLTSSGPGAAPGEPDKYYPTGQRTFARVVPGDAVQSQAEVELEQQTGCRRTFVLHDGEVDGSAEAITFALTAQSRGLAVAALQAFTPGALNYDSLAASVAQTGVGCVLISAIDGPSAARLARALATDLPNATIFATSSLAQPGFTDPARGGVPNGLDSRVLLVCPALSPAFYPPAGRAVITAYTRRFGSSDPHAIYGFAAMTLVLDAIRQATDGGRRPAQRSRVLADVFARSPHQSVLGPYSIDGNGDTSLHSYGAYRILDGKMTFLRRLEG